MATKRRIKSKQNIKRTEKITSVNSDDTTNNIDLQNDTKKSNIEETKYKNILFEYFNYYKNKLIRKNIVIFILSVLLFAIFLGNYISNLNNSDFLEQVKNIGTSQANYGVISNIIKNKIPTLFIIILAGITPYFYISTLGIFSGVQLASEIFSKISVANNTNSIVFMCIGAIIQMVGFSLAASTGMNWCTIMIKRNRYFSGRENSVLDFRQEYYRLKNDSKKLEQLKKKKKEKLLKNEKNNVKVPYKMFIMSFLISCLIVILGTLIFYI